MELGEFCLPIELISVGIMDITSGKFPGVYQFHPENAATMCAKVNSLHTDFPDCTAWSPNAKEPKCVDTPPPTTIFVNGVEKSCPELSAYCESNTFIQQTCRATCSDCIQITSPRPTLYPTPSPTSTELNSTTLQPTADQTRPIQYLADGGGISNGRLLPCIIPFYVDNREFNGCVDIGKVPPYLAKNTASGFPHDPVYSGETSQWCAIREAVYSAENEERRTMWGYCRKLTRAPTTSPEGVMPPDDGLANRTGVDLPPDYRFLSFVPLVFVPAFAAYTKLCGK